MKCLKSQTENPNTQKFCNEYGTKFEKVCTKCGYSNPPQYELYAKGAHNLTPPSELTPKELPLKKVTRFNHVSPKASQRKS